MVSRRRVAVVLGVLCLVVLAGCGTGGSGGDAGNAAPNGSGGSSGGAGGGAADGGGGGAATEQAARGSNDGSAATGAQAAERALVRDGTIRLEVSAYDAARANLTAAVAANGGFVAESSEEVHEAANETFTTGRIVFRVPSGNFSAFVERVGATGEVLSSQSTTEDVTDRLVDLRARLSNAEAERDRLRNLYESANETEDVLAVSRELSAAQERVERLDAQLAALEGRVALSTVTVDLREPHPEPAAAEAGTAFHETDVVAALAWSVGGVVRLVRSLVVALAYALPYLVVLAVPVGVAAALYRRVG
ncbi:DUF4349 domain-containing protein [Halomarina salina]|uniref:DUF4349 domain-containing protein n=1 Tax=Halomarina salina TaxID=1872699 RepID=A0ABD5RQ93_9EURY|nr:DUF4349 domain-containing protein [Halomarina salina]